LRVTIFRSRLRGKMKSIRSHMRYDLFAPIQPYETGYLQVDDIHQIYWEQSGNPEGVPIVLMHGGPGAGTSPIQRQFFDPEYYRIIIFDQRGAGKSKPFASLENNTTEHLISDIEKLRTHLEIDRWHVFGGSWGSTLALAYAQDYPDRCISMILRGIFLMRQKEIDWFLEGIKGIFPDVWHEFVGYLGADNEDNILNEYYRLLTHSSENVQLEAARHWEAFESAICTLHSNGLIFVNKEKRKEDVLAIARIEAHYFMHNKFIPEAKLLDNAHKIRHIPTAIIQGRYDVICPVSTSYELHKELPDAEYIIVPDAGHSAFETGIKSELIAATERYKSLQ